jgi:hypothetical protein
LVRQQIRTMALRMTLEEGGLEISADGELDDLEPAGSPRYREHCNLQFGPIRTYELAATLPWALLVAKGFKFANRARGS